MLPDKTTSTTTTQGGGGATSISISTLHPDIISTHLLTRLDGPSLASLSCASSQLHSLSEDEALWTDTCLSTWPSIIDHSRMRQFVSEFPNGGPRAFFSNSFPLLISQDQDGGQDPPSHSHQSPTTLELISAVDIHHDGNLIFSKVQEMETNSAWFRCSPFRVDLLDPKDVVPTSINSCANLLHEVSLSWIIVNPIRRQAANLSSWRPVSVQRHWLTNDILVRFATILRVDRETEVQCGIMVVFGREMQVKEVSLQVEDMEGVNLNGKESLGILERGIERGERRKGRRGEGRERYEEYVRRGREMRVNKMRKEGRLDAFCVAIGVSILVSFWILILSI